MHAKDQIQKGTTMERIVELRKANPGGGPHSITGPIYVNGAEPGDVLEIRILKITPKAFGTNFNLPGKEFPTIGTLATVLQLLKLPDQTVRVLVGGRAGPDRVGRGSAGSLRRSTVQSRAARSAAQTGGTTRTRAYSKTSGAVTGGSPPARSGRAAAGARRRHPRRGRRTIPAGPARSPPPAGPR